MFSIEDTIVIAVTRAEIRDFCPARMKSVVNGNIISFTKRKKRKIRNGFQIDIL